MKISKDNLELLLRARDYLELVQDELENDDSIPDDFSDDDPVMNLGLALSHLNVAIESIE